MGRQDVIPSLPNSRMCFVNCGLPGDECACFRAQMQEIFTDLSNSQEPLGADFEAALAEKTEDLYEA